MPLTNMQVSKAAPRESAYKMSDGGGLYLLVKPNGRKYWQYAYRYLGSQQLISFGTYPEVSLALARSKHQDPAGYLKMAETPAQYVRMRSGRPSFKPPIHLR